MANTRIIYLTLFLVLWLYSGGLCYAVSAPNLPCKVTSEDENLVPYLRFCLNYRYLASQLVQSANREGMNLRKYDHVAFWYWEERNRWICYANYPASKGGQPLFVQTDNGEFELVFPKVYRP
jgi:hypothetical protein